jgi:hypothetical protein
MGRMNCEIYPIPYRSSFRWKWRRTTPAGSVEESAESYALYYECVLAARNSGYQPAVGVP